LKTNFPAHFDPGYFSPEPWRKRLQSWLDKIKEGFASANAQSIERMLADPRTSVRVVINIRPDALITFLEEGHYRNIYELHQIGARVVDQNRLDADAKVGTGPDHYFAAAAMGGVGIRYYGEYCMVLKPGFGAHDTQIFDRDSYDLLFAPLENLTNEEIDCLKGSWSKDVASMILLRVLPELDHQRQIVTSGTVIELALKDQEFIEVHIAQAIQPKDVDQIVESPETAAMETRILEHQRNGLPNHMHELEWVRRRTEVVRRLEREGIRHRVVTQHGRGFQWR
jgi:hypothetical protein